MFVGQLQRVNDAEDFGRITAGAGGVVNDGADDLFGVDEENSTNGQRHTLGVNVGGILVIDHVVEVCHFARLVGDDGERQRASGHLIDILDPFLMRVQGVGTQSNELDSSFLEFRLEFGEGAELSHVSIRRYETKAGE